MRHSAVLNMVKVGEAPRVAAGVLRVSLGYREMLVLEGDRCGTQVVSTGGILWITQQDDPDDYVLEPGDRFTIDRPGRVVLQGMRWAG